MLYHCGNLPIPLWDWRCTASEPAAMWPTHSRNWTLSLCHACKISQPQSSILRMLPISACPPSDMAGMSYQPFSSWSARRIDQNALPLRLSPTVCGMDEGRQGYLNPHRKVPQAIGLITQINQVLPPIQPPTLSSPGSRYSPPRQIWWERVVPPG